MEVKELFPFGRQFEANVSGMVMWAEEYLFSFFLG